jgi:hypothetical protein
VVEDDAISWRTIVYGTPVLAGDGKRIGTVREVLGDDAEDIFHGLRVELDAHRRNVMVSASDVANLSRDELHVTLTADEVAGLPDYDETTTYHLASVGWLRKHLGWKKDSASDEEPG